MPAERLEKFDRSPLFERVYDNGNILVYRYLLAAGEHLAGADARREPAPRRSGRQSRPGAAIAAPSADRRRRLDQAIRATRRRPPGRSG